MRDLRGHSMYIATRRARLEAREAGFLVLENAISHAPLLCNWQLIDLDVSTAPA